MIGSAAVKVKLIRIRFSLHLGLPLESIGVFLTIMAYTTSSTIIVPNTNVESIRTYIF
jgi:hypothetical protein